MFSCGAYSDRGRKKENQDGLLLISSYIAPQRISEGSHIAILADGVSSCKNPKQASNLSIHTFLRKILEQYQSSNNMEHCIASSLAEANDALYFTDHYERQPALLSTFSGIIFKSDKAHIFNVGDSRAYRFYKNNLECLTQDQSHQKGIYKGALASALGANSTIQSQYFERALIPGESYFIASDGVYESISNEELKSFLRETEEITNPSALNHIMEKICNAAYQNGSCDNLTCLLIQIPVHNVDVKNLHNVFSKRRRKQFLPALQVGETIDDFTVLKELVSSPRSQIYLVEDNKTLEQRVIKTPSVYFNDDPIYIQRFFKEEQTGLQFDHQSILKFYPKSLDSQYIYHVTEFINGQTLRSYLATHAPLSIDITIELLSKIIVSLRVLHRAHLLHQDLKPENIMITSKGDVKIIDLGSVSSLILQDNSSAPPGSLEYTAPEYYSGKPKGIYSDLFSLAIIAYEMLTNNKPFTSQQISHSKQQLSFNAPHILNNQLPVYLSSVFDRAFSIEPKTRYQALSEFISELDPINHKFKITTQPLLYRNPLLFWKSLSIILLVINIFLIFNLST